MRLRGFLPTTRASAALQRETKTGAPTAYRFKPQQAITQFCSSARFCVLQRAARRLAKSPNRFGSCGEKSTRAETTSIFCSLNCREQSWRLRRNRLVKQRLLFWISRALQQQRAHFPSGADPAHPRACRIAASSGVRVCRAPGCEYYAFTDSKRRVSPL